MKGLRVRIGKVSLEKARIVVDIFLTYLSPHGSNFLWSATECLDDILPVKQSNVDVHVDRRKALKQTLNQGVHGTCGAHVSMKWLPDYTQSFDSTFDSSLSKRQ
jgi:hypothetical protein